MMIQRENNIQQIQEAILNDKELQRLSAKKAEIYNSVGIQSVIVGEKTRISVNQNADKLIQKVDELIEFRTGQIIEFYK